MAKIITLISSTAGVGKTYVGVNFAHRLAALGHRTCLFNADADTTTAHRLLGIDPRCSLDDLISNRHSVEHVLHGGPAGFDFFPGTPGLERLSGLKSSEQYRLIRSFQRFNAYDYFILDTFPGLSKNVVAFSKASTAVVLIVTPEPPALTDAYLFLKVLSGNEFEGPVMVITNKCKTVKAARAAYLKFKAAVEKFLPLNIKPLGSIIFDPNVERADKARQQFSALCPETKASTCVDQIVRHVVDNRIEDMAVTDFWARYLEEMKKPYRLAIARPMNRLRKHIKERPGADGSAMASAGSTFEPAYGDNQPDGSRIPLSPEITNRLNQLEKQIALLSQDIEEIKYSIQKRGSSMPDSDSAPMDGDSMIRIPLDFEAYVRQRESEG